VQSAAQKQKLTTNSSGQWHKYDYTNKKKDTQNQTIRIGKEDQSSFKKKGCRQNLKKSLTTRKKRPPFFWGHFRAYHYTQYTRSQSVYGFSKMTNKNLTGINARFLYEKFV